jgi:hypothetical protein
MDRSPENHYQCGTVEEWRRSSRRWRNIAVVFAWTSSPHLDNAMKILREWGFTYKAYSGWDKEVDGTGYWGLSRLELILIATKGSKIPAPAPGEQFPQLFRARRGKHSEKPDEVYEEIARLYPNLIKLEMFARKPRHVADVGPRSGRVHRDRRAYGGAGAVGRARRARQDLRAGERNPARAPARKAAGRGTNGSGADPSASVMAAPAPGEVLERGFGITH